MRGFYRGVIEGFYGRQWRWSDRLSIAEFLADAGYDCHVYAPKGDRALRGNWRQPFSASWLSDVSAWGAHCRRLGVRWGLGFSPLGLHHDYDQRGREDLGRKLAEIRKLAPDILWILFDDMRGDVPDLARIQCDIVADVHSVDAPWELAVCPSYYSFDPILDQVFGQRPPHYLEDLGATLPADIGILWTGESVLSPRIHTEDCERVAKLIRRKPLLWDNYPVNDGHLTSNFLHLDAFRGRSWRLQEHASAHMVNPMNQPFLSRLPLASLDALYRRREGYRPGRARERAFATLSEPLRVLLRRDWRRFQQQGLSSLDEDRRKSLLADYARLPDPEAREVVEWLRGEYRFDPSCLTDS